MHREFFVGSQSARRSRREGSRIIKKHDKPKTPYQRLLESGVSTKEQRESLEEQFQKLAPLTLKADIEKHLKKIFSCLKKEKLRRLRSEEERSVAA